MKFTGDGWGWHDLELGDNEQTLTLHIPVDRVDATPFISCGDADGFAHFDFKSKKQLRKFAEAILKELDNA